MAASCNHRIFMRQLANKLPFFEGTNMMNKKICSSILTVAMVATLSVPIHAQATGWIENNGKWTYVTEEAN